MTIKSRQTTMFTFQSIDWDLKKMCGCEICYVWRMRTYRYAKRAVRVRIVRRPITLFRVTQVWMNAMLMNIFMATLFLWWFYLPYFLSEALQLIHFYSLEWALKLHTPLHSVFGSRHFIRNTWMEIPNFPCSIMCPSPRNWSVVTVHVIWYHKGLKNTVISSS